MEGEFAAAKQTNGNAVHVVQGGESKDRSRPSDACSGYGHSASSMRPLEFRVRVSKKGKQQMTWAHGQKTDLAKASGMSLQYLSDILHGRKRATPERAERIEREASHMGIHLSRFDLMYPHKSNNPLILV